MPTEERKEQLNKACEQVNDRLSSNAQIFGKSILSLSSAGIGFLLAFIKNAVSPDTAIAIWLLYVSCALFALAMVATLCSFFIGQRGLLQQFAQFERELADQDGSRHKSKARALFKITAGLAYVSVGFYIAAVACTVFLIISILKKGGSIMATEKTQSADTRLVDTQPVDQKWTPPGSIPEWTPPVLIPDPNVGQDLSQGSPDVGQDPPQGSPDVGQDLSQGSPDVGQDPPPKHE